MTAQNFHTPVSNGAYGMAEEGLGKWSRQCGGEQRRAVRLSYRLAQDMPTPEHTLIDRICASVEAQGIVLPRAFVTEYYVSLKTNPFVVLTGGSSEVHTALVQGCAEAIVGVGSSQYVHIAGGASWPRGTGERGYYHSLLERFESLRFLELLQEAAAQENQGKTYLLYLDGLHPDEINHFFSSLLWLTDEGEKRLALPGLPPEQQPVVPDNLFITAHLQVLAEDYRLHQQVLRHAGILRAPQNVDRCLSQRSLSLPAVGYQRIMLDSVVHDVDVARCKIGELLGEQYVNTLRLSPELSRLLWRGGVVLGSKTLRDLTRYVANSFDKKGHGLFDASDPRRNAQLALDVHAAQRVVWMLPEDHAGALRQEMTDYRIALLSSV